MKNWMSPRQFSSLTGLRIETIRSYIANGRIFAVKVGGAYRIPLEEYEEFKAGRRPPVKKS